MEQFKPQPGPTTAVTAEHLAVLPHPAAIAKVTGELEFVNRSFRKLLGYDVQRYPSERVEDVVALGHLPQFRAEWLRAISGAPDVHIDLQLLKADGTSRWVRLALSICHPHNAGPRILGFATDIEDQKAGEAEVERLKFAIEGAGQGVWDHNLVTGTAYHSPNWYRMRGFEPGEDIDRIMGGNWFDRLHPDERETIRAIAERQNRGELAFNAFEYRERHRNGSWLWVASRGKPVAWNPDGTVARIVGTDTDITALKAVETRLAEEKERLRVTLEAIADGMISTDAGGNVTFLNPAAAAMTGWSLDEAIGRPIEEVYPVSGSETGIAHVVRRCMATRSPAIDSDDIVLAARSGAEVDVRHSASPLLAPEGDVLGAVLVFQDISQSTALRRQLAHSATHDPLTGLPNRTAYGQAIEQASLSARRELREHALCYLDLDHFKAVNDGAGHAAGDEVLKRVADVIAASCRASDFAGRIGGDEFVLLLADCDANVAARKCEALIDKIDALRFEFGGLTYRVGASIGITAITSRDPSPGELTSQADAACYQSKTAGRGRVTIYHPD